MAATVKKTGSKKSKRNVPNGVVHIQSTFNNTIVSITDTSGHVISWSSAGASGFKGARKGTPFAAQTAAEAAARRALDQGMRQIEVLVRGLRHRMSLPVRCQRTRTNARTRRGSRKTVAGRKK